MIGIKIKIETVSKLVTSTEMKLNCGIHIVNFRFQIFTLMRCREIGFSGVIVFALCAHTLLKLQYHGIHRKYCSIRLLRKFCLPESEINLIYNIHLCGYRFYQNLLIYIYMIYLLYAICRGGQNLCSTLIFIEREDNNCLFLISNY